MVIEELRGIFYNSFVNNIGLENYYDFDIDYIFISFLFCVGLLGCLEVFGDQVIYEVYFYFLDILLGDLRLFVCLLVFNMGLNEVVIFDIDL